MEVKATENGAKETISGRSIEILFCSLMFKGRKFNFKKIRYLFLCVLYIYIYLFIYLFFFFQYQGHSVKLRIL